MLHLTDYNEIVSNSFVSCQQNITLGWISNTKRSEGGQNKSRNRHWLNSQYSAINMKRILLIILFTPSILSRLSHKKQLATTRFNKMWTRNHQTNTKIRVGYIPLIYTDFTTPLDYAFQQQDTLRGNTEDNTEDPTQTGTGKIRREALHTPPKRG